MNCKSVILFVGSVAIVCGIYPLRADQAGSASLGERVAKNPYSLIHERLDAFQGSLSVDELERIGVDISRLNVGKRSDSGEWAVQRRAKLELWLKAIDIVDRTIDPGFDSGDVPKMNIALPGIAMDSGVDVSTIEDAAVRGQYEKALAENAAKADRYRVQTKLRRLDAAWSATLDAYIKSTYKSQTEDREELVHCVDTCVSNAMRRVQIMRALDLR